MSQLSACSGGSREKSHDSDGLYSSAEKERTLDRRQVEKSASML